MVTAIDDEMFSGKAIDDPYGYFGQLREEDPIHWNEKYEMWVITRYDDVVWLTRHPEVLTGDSFFHLNPLGERPLPGFQFCGAARLTCLITPNGDVFPCAFTQAEEFRGGNLRLTPFREIWDGSEVFNRIVRREASGACTSCSDFEGCGGGCPAVKQALVGRLDVPDPDCVWETAHAGLDLTPLCQG